jgi:hypothetical protein
MNIRIGIYDFFAYAIPGGLYLFIVVYACTIFVIVQVDWLSFDLSAIQIVVVAGIAYIFGMILEPIAKLWYRLFKPKDFPDLALEQFKQFHPSLEIKFQSVDWPILLAYIRRESIDIATEIERVNASNIMRRSISFGLMILSLVQIAQFAHTLFASHLILSVIFAVSSVIAGKESVKFARWFYFGIFEAMASRSLQVSSLVEHKQQGAASDG